MANQPLSGILASALNLVNSQLLSFATDPQFHEKLTLAFSDAINPESYRQLWTNSNFNIEPVIEIRSQNELNGANGAYSQDTNKIYIASEYLLSVIARHEAIPTSLRVNEAISTLTALILEEYGHYLDTVINGDNDSAGDEGAIFSSLVMGETLIPETLQALKSEDDTATITINGQTIQIEQNTPNSPLINGLGGTAGFGENFLARNDDGSTGFINVTSVFESGLNFFGTTYNGFYINNNGNITFNSAQSTYTPFAITGNTSQPIIAPFFADVDTRVTTMTPSVGGTSTGSNLVYWDLNPTNNKVIITWDDVGQYPSGTTPNAFQLVLTDTGNGNFDIEFRYEQIDWLVGSASSNILARAGYSAGNGVNFFELAQSGTNTMATLETASNVNQAGRYKFSVISGTPVVPGILSFGATQFSVNEDGTLIASVTVTRTEGSGGAVSAKINFKDGTAKSPSDYTNTPITVNFAAGEISKTVNIPIINDTLVEGDETVQLILTNPTGGATIGQQNIATLTIVDNDSSLVITSLPQGSTGSNKGQVTVVIAGQNFSPTDQISLISPTGTAKVASKIYWVNDTEVWATFDLQGLATGAYDVKVANGSNSAILNDRFSVTDGSLGNLNVQLTYPSQNIITLEYRNAGQTDLVAPLLRIVPTNAALTYPEDTTTSATLKRLLNLVAATGEDSPSGILSPGESGEISFAFTPNGNGLISFAVEQVKSDEVINWATIKAEVRTEYSFIDAAAWDAIWTNLTASLGTTVGQFQAVMGENANYLSQLGQETNDLRRLFAFEWQQAANNLSNISLISTTDVVDSAPGLSLTFNRTFYQSIAERYNLGSLGRGWASQWDLRATTDSNGDVIIRSVGDLQRLFEKQDNGTFLEDGGATLTLVSGQYRLKEANGLISLFGTNGKLNYVEDTNGNRITLQYTNNQLTKLLHTNGDSLTLTYNAQGRINKITDTAGQATNYSYDASGEHLLSVTGVDGTITYTYDTGTVATKKHSLLSVKSDLGYQRSFEYDNQGRLTKESSNGNTQVLTYSYDTVGGVTITDSTGATQTVLLDDRGNGGQIRGVNNQNLLFSYDADGNLVNATLPNGNQPAYTYDAKGNLVQQTNLLGQSTNFTYDATFNQLASFTDPKGNGVGYSYDAKGHLNKITYADGSTQQFTIDALGNVTSYINRRGNTIGYTYNTSGLLTKKQYANGSSITYGYDARSNLTSVVDGTGTTTMQYDTADRMTKITYPTGRSLTYTYNADGQRTKLVSSDGYTTNYSYDTVGRLKTLTNATGQTIISYDYDSAGRLTKETNGNGTYTTYEYDSQDQLIKLINYKANNTVNSKFEYTYDNLGRRTTMTTLEGVFKYGYDAIGQLTSVVTPTNRTITYTYDAAGNRVGVTDSSTTTNYTSNNLNQYTNVGNALYTYDSDGNLISKTEGSQTSTYTYDAESRLVKVVTPSGTWDYQYDGLGNRVATILNGQRTEYLLDPMGLGDIVGEYNGSTLVANYTHGIGLVSRVNGTNSNYYDADAIGSTVGLTATDGSYVNRYSYLPFGEDLTKVEGVANPFEYVGQWGVMDEGNGLDFMRARFYDTGLGRFTSVDPLNLAGGTSNLYSYTANQPTNAIDPTGEFAWILGGAAIGATANTLVYAATNYGNYSAGGWAGAVASGAISGGLTASGLGVGVGAGIVSGAASNAIGYGVQSAIDGKWNTKDFLAQTAIGGVTGIIPGTIGYKGQGASAIGSKYLFKPQSLAGYLRQFGKTFFGQNKTGLALWKGLGAGSIAGGILSSGYETLKGGTYNDPHLNTLDGVGYDFQTVGEFTLVKSTTDDFEIQTRQQPWGTSTSASANTAIAIKSGGQRIAIYANQTNPLLINGTAVTLPEGGLYAVGQNLVTRSGSEYRIFTANNDLILVNNRGTWLNISLGLADNRKSKVVGLLGNFNDNRNDDFALRNGTVIGGTISDTRLYSDYAASWRITQTTSLFDYGADQSTTTFTDLTFPRNVITTASLTPEQRAAAEQIARNAGITDPDVLEDLILDIFISNGNLDLIQGGLDQQRLETVNAPNTLINPDGLGTQHFLTTSAVIPYVIRFSNNATAGTTPVAQVTITQTLDADLDLNTFTLDDISFGDINLDVPNGTQNYSQRLDLRNTRNVFVDVNASLNTTTRVLTWTFTAIDPATGNAANSATQGFLPPNNANGAGEGFVGYRIQSKANSTTNSRIDAQASITFNSQTPILTNPVFNTLDGNAPTSQVTALPANSNANFTVTWTGSDTGSGLASYDIYVSVDNGVYTLWKDNVTATSATYNGQTGKTYRFYSIATDNLGITETSPTQADATTTVGTDTLESNVTTTLPEGVRNLILTGTGNINGTGNSLNNFITGNSGNNSLNGGIGNDTLIAGTGNDTLNGSTGADSLIGGTGNDTYYVDDIGDRVIENANEVTDIIFSTITYTLPDHIENLTLTGTGGIHGTGNALNNRITGNSGNNNLNGGVGNDSLQGETGNDTLTGETGNDTLTGGIGNDSMYGGSGNDIYYVDVTGDRVVELSNEGTDTVRSTITYTLGTNVENLVLEGIGNINGTGNTLNNSIIGNNLNNIINGSSGNDTLNGRGGNDTLTGGTGNDSMYGGSGNDTYYVDATGDRVMENTNEGTDTVISSITYTQGGNVEKLILTGTGNINGTGNSLNNNITGNSGNNNLNGGAGNDSLWGETGNDTLTGGSGNDTLTGGTGNDSMYGGSGNDIYYVDVTGDRVVELLNEGTDTVRSTIAYTLGANVENLILEGIGNINGTGNTLNNSITGNSSNNILSAGIGNDTLKGGIGNDSMYGDKGNDTYYVDVTGDQVVELLNEGTDTVFSSITYTLTTNVENLTLTGIENINSIGNILDNRITGNISNNSLKGNAGNDTLDGSIGADTLMGGTGNDTYYVENVGDVILETSTVTTEIDLVHSSLSYTLGINLENLTLTGTDNINGIGNALNNVIRGNNGNNRLRGDVGNDTLLGNAGNDTLEGGIGYDSLIGASGDDTYYVDKISNANGTLRDQVVELANEGIDTVISSITYTLGANLENLTLTGTTNINGTGNTLNNLIQGNGGNNLLSGDAGNDTLMGSYGNDTFTGATGNDFFHFDSPLEGIDRISDFSVIDDTILVNHIGFGGGLAIGTLPSNQFTLGASATTPAHRFIYNSSNGGLFFDVDGSGATAAVQFATLNTGLAMTNTDFVVI